MGISEDRMLGFPASYRTKEGAYFPLFENKSFPLFEDYLEAPIY